MSRKVCQTPKTNTEQCSCIFGCSHCWPIRRSTTCHCKALGKNRIEITRQKINWVSIPAQKNRSYYRFIAQKKEGKYSTYTDNIIFFKDSPHVKFINSSSPSRKESRKKLATILDKNTNKISNETTMHSVIVEVVLRHFHRHCLKSRWFFCWRGLRSLRC
jgi:hypothetical protein